MSKTKQNGQTGTAGTATASSGNSAGNDDYSDLNKTQNGALDGDRQYLAEVVKSDVGSQYIEFMEAELSRAHQLANRSEAEFWEFKNMVHKRTFEYLAQHPPSGSRMTGPARKLVYGDGLGDKTPLTPDQVREIESIESLILAKASGGKDMAQQDIIKTMRQEQTRYTEREGEGLLGRLFG
ncbi:hypothetical protein [Halorussus pelagicus]|uniref:hypothetical protein n=1 Tax=Halorussus pelagicus TaxID=2505977 RepID=UPI000FFC0E43|nr:hypothetical protein [Halorussus pelagicus]